MTWLPFVILLVFAVLFVAMPWRRPHPNHLFIFELIDRLSSGYARHFAVHASSPGKRYPGTRIRAG